MILQTTEVVNQYRIRHEFIKRLHKRYGEEGIEIPFPIRTIHSADKPNGRDDGPWAGEAPRQEDGRSSN